MLMSPNFLLRTKEWNSSVGEEVSDRSEMGREARESLNLSDVRPVLLSWIGVIMSEMCLNSISSASSLNRPLRFS